MNSTKHQILLATKFFPPRLRNRTLLRQRLLDRLNSLYERRIALVCAPAGYGKTTLLSSWAASLQTTKVLWISLEQEDNDPCVFWHAVLAAMDMSELSASFPQANEEHVIRLLLTRLLNEAARSLDSLMLILDDYHLIQNESIHTHLLFLIEHCPPTMHFVLATRSIPPLPLARLRLQQELIELHLEDLRFTHAEVAAFLQREYDAHLEEADLSLLEEQTEGWIAGLQLAVLSLNGRAEGPARLKRLSGNQQYIFEYLVEEVLSHLSTEEQTFLLNTSLLSRLCSGVCGVLTENQCSQALLTRLVQANLFLVPLDEQGNWYRYHHLFAETLYQLLLQRAPDSIPILHRQASSWYEQHGFLEEAFEHLLAIPDVEQAARLIRSAGQAMILRGDMRLLRNWIERLPRSLVQTDLALSMAHFWTLADAHCLQEAEQSLACVQQIFYSGPNAGRASLQVAIWSATSLYERYRKHFSQAITLLSQALEKTPQQEYHQHCYMSLHLAEYHWSGGSLSQARHALQNSLKASEAGQFPFFIAADWLYFSRMQALGGQLEQAVTSYQRTLHLAEERAGHSISLAGDAHLGLALLYYEFNDLASAQQHLQECECLSQRVGDSHILSYASLLQAQILLAQGDTRGARAALPAFDVRPDDFDFFFLYDGFVERYTRVQVMLGEYESVTHLLNQLDEIEIPLLLHEDVQLARARLYLARSQDELEVGHLQPLLQRALNDGRKRSALRIMLVQALLLGRKGLSSRASSLLVRALALVEHTPTLRSFVDDHEALYSLLVGLQNHPSVSQEYLSRLLVAFPSNTHSATNVPGLLPLETFILRDPLSEREREILHLIAAGHSNQEIAAQLVIALSTLKTHIYRMYTKLGVSSRTQALARARSLRLL